MASAGQLKTLIKSFSEQDTARFYRVALQLAAHEAPGRSLRPRET
jgi:hypothetical protein